MVSSITSNALSRSPVSAMASARNAFPCGRLLPLASENALAALSNAIPSAILPSRISAIPYKADANCAHSAITLPAERAIRVQQTTQLLGVELLLSAVEPTKSQNITV